MKTNLHPTVRQVVFKDVPSDFSFLGTSTMDSLQNVVERGVILCDGETFSVDETWLKNESPQEASSLSVSATRLLRLHEDQEREMTRRHWQRARAGLRARLAPPAS